MNALPVTFQSVLARLVTNPNYTINNFNNITELLKPFSLTVENKKQLEEFFKSYGKQFLGSTILLKKRRLDNIRQSLQIVSGLFEPKILTEYWERYLTELQLSDCTPKNPLIESIKFCEFIKTDSSLSPAIKALISYEIIRNSTIVDYSLDFQSYKADSILHGNDLDLLESSQLIIHPCYRTHWFDCNVSTLIKMMNQDQKKTNLDSYYISKSELFLFYKNWQKGGVASIKISGSIEFMIKLIASTKVYEEINKKVKLHCHVSDDVLVNLIMTLCKNGVIKLIK